MELPIYTSKKIVKVGRNVTTLEATPKMNSKNMGSVKSSISSVIKSDLVQNATLFKD